MRTIAIPLLLLLTACGGDSFRKVEVLDDFRILGVVADAPEVAPAGTATLQLLVSDPDGGGRVLNGTTEVCRDPGVGNGATVSCDHDPATVSGTYTIDTTTADMSSNGRTGLAADTLVVTVPNTIFTGRSALEQFNGVAMIAVFRFTVDGREHVAFKRVVATNRGELNTNPTGSAVLLNGAAIASSPATGDRLKATTSAPESYQIVNAEGDTETRLENYEVAWFVTKGKFDKPKAEIGEVVEFEEDGATSSFLVMAVIRDERGGIDFVREFFP